jgi:hypothetical protein
MLRSIKRIFVDVRLVRMSDGHLALVRNLGLVKGGRGLKLHEKIVSLSLTSLSRNRDKVTNHAFHAAEATAAVSRT